MMEDFELDEGALYGAEEGESQLRSSDDLNAAARKSDDDGAPAVQLQQDGLGSYLNDSDDEASTTVDVGENLRDGLSSMQSFSGFTPIPGSYAYPLLSPLHLLIFPSCAWGISRYLDPFANA